ncbi:MAG: PEP-utilizing enzyme [Candidatus Margulisiibacteriota bacterium]
MIAPNTRPEYLPIMRKALAVVTQEGGITSHAAIVSRELGIPAVVGVQGILDKLKDGDRVEVNANSGIVKII